MAADNGWKFDASVIYNDPLLLSFRFFDSRPIEQKENTVSGTYKSSGVQWEISDLTFDEGALVAKEVYHTTVQVLRLPFALARFEIEREGMVRQFFDRFKSFSGYQDIDFKLFTDFSNRFLVKGPDEAAIREVFHEGLIAFLQNQEIYHIECNGEALFIFKYLRTARSPEIEKMLHFSEDLLTPPYPCSGVDLLPYIWANHWTHAGIHRLFRGPTSFRKNCFGS